VPHWLFPQKRLPSGTFGSVSIAAAGSPRGTRGIVTIPAPRRPRVLDAERDDPVRIVPVDRAVGRLIAVPRVPEVPAVGADPGGAGAVPQTSQ
jgi:hypothetical protein